MKNIHIHRDTYYIDFYYESRHVFALIDSNEIDHDDDKPCTLVNSFGIPYYCTRRELLSILREDASTNVKQYTVKDYYDDAIPEWEAEEYKTTK